MPNQRWAGDRTELRIGDSGRLFLAVIIDLFSRFTVGGRSGGQRPTPRGDRVQHEPPRELHDNAAMESWFSMLKSELGERFESCAEAKEKIFDYVEVFYNPRRIDSSIGYLSPAEFERRHRVEATAQVAA